MNSTESDLSRRIEEREVFLAPLREAFDRAMSDVVLEFFKYWSRIPIPKVPDYKEMRI